MSIYRRDLFIIFALTLLVRILAALPQTQPNYMDAAYYTVGGQRLAQGYGFTDPYVWNYLDQPTTLPHPSHLYWMPLPSILVGASQSIFGVTYRAAQVPFIVLSALLPLIAYSIAWQLSAKRRHAWLAALLTIFSAFYLPYWGVPESFAPFAVFGSLALVLGSRQGDNLTPRYSGRASRETPKQGILTAPLAGVCVGLAHLSRADGFLLLIPVLIDAERGARRAEGGLLRRRFSLHPSALVPVFLGYLLVMTPWFIRNLSVIGAPLSSAGTQAAWVCNYDELFSYGVRFDVSHLIGCGLAQILAAKINGVLAGLVHLGVENGLVFLALPIALGLWQTRRHALIRGALIYLGLVFGVMTIVFTFAGDRGGLFHSTSALLPFFYTAAPIGLDSLIGWIAMRRRTWHAARARSIFGVALVGMALMLSLIVWRGRVIGPDAADPAWNQSDRVYRPIKQWFSDRGEQASIVMVNSPPEFYYHTGLQSIVIPIGSVATLLQAADRFGARWLLIDQAQTRSLGGFDVDHALSMRLRRTMDFGDLALYQITQP